MIGQAEYRRQRKLFRSQRTALGIELQRIREALGISAAQAGARVGFSYEQVYDMEHGKCMMADRYASYKCDLMHTVGQP